jgi:hypothetical protein
MMAALPGIGIFGTNAAVHLLTPVFREKVRALAGSRFDAFAFLRVQILSSIIHEVNEILSDLELVQIFSYLCYIVGIA